MTRTALGVTGFGVAGVLLYLSPYFLLGQDAHVLIHDHLDVIHHNWRFLHSQNPLWRSGQPDASFMAGSHAVPAGPDLHAEWWAYYFLPPFAAFVLMQVVSRLIGFAGMYLLVRSLWPGMPYSVWIAATTSLLFALVDHHPVIPCTILVLPWICYGLLRVHRGDARWWHWIALCVAPFFTFFVLAPLFLLIVLGLFWLIAGLRTRRWQLRTAAALTLTGALCVASSYELVLHALGGDYVSHRSVRQVRNDPDWVSLRAPWKLAQSNFLRGHPNFRHMELIVGLAVGTLVVALARSVWKRRNDHPSHVVGDPEPSVPLLSPVRMVVLMVSLAAVFALIRGLSFWQPVGRVWHSLPVVGMLDMSRFYWLGPIIWYLALAASLRYWTDLPWLRGRRHLVMALVGVVFAVQSYLLVVGSDRLEEQRAGRPTYRQFFAERQFARVREFIAEPPSTYRVASLGIHPAIAHFNGFYCLDGYSPDYSAEHYREFRTIIAPELDRSDRLRAAFDPRRPEPPPFHCKQYFDTWGNRCYVPSAELPTTFRYMWTKDKKGGIERLDIDRDAFRKMGGRYILSAVEIYRAEECGLLLVAVFDDEWRESAWRVHLYEVLP